MWVVKRESDRLLAPPRSGYPRSVRLSPPECQSPTSFGAQAQVVEVVCMSALTVYANIMADATAMENDETFDRL